MNIGNNNSEDKISLQDLQCQARSNLDKEVNKASVNEELVLEETFALSESQEMMSQEALLADNLNNNNNFTFDRAGYSYNVSNLNKFNYFVSQGLSNHIESKPYNSKSSSSWLNIRNPEKCPILDMNKVRNDLELLLKLLSNDGEKVIDAGTVHMRALRERKKCPCISIKVSKKFIEPDELKKN